ncbi:interferon-inducible GTPase-domain-containing protein [Fomitopsis betulina]|nr:interferon-inducible GTPase-domain-containing protein [Fomitopsis betulina]
METNMPNTLLDGLYVVMQSGRATARSIARFFTNISRLFEMGRAAVYRHSQVGRLTRRLEENERAMNASLQTQVAATAAYNDAHEEFLRAQEQMAVTERNLRIYEQELHGARVAQTNGEGDRKRAEAEQREMEERRREAEDRTTKAVQERTRADNEARGALSQRDDAVLSRQDAEAVALYARKQLEVAENNLREGVRPVVWPTLEELSAAKERLEYEEGLFHFAIAGIAGSGKSSMANAVRGLRNSDEGAAPTGVVETTSAVGRFPDPDPKHPFVWYDVPGAGTLAVPDWQYFTDQSLYIFDCIIVLFDTRLTATDIAILRNAARFDIPTYIVRSKALQHVHNLATDMPGEDDEDDEDAETNPLVLQRAREKYVQETRASIAQNLQAAKLPQQRVYLVDKDTLVKVVKNKPIKDPIDELDLLHDLLAEAHRRQVDQS